MITRPDIAAMLEHSVRTNVLIGTKSYLSKRGPFTMETDSDGAFELYADMSTLPWPGSEPGGGQVGNTGKDERTDVPRTGGLLDGGLITIHGGQDQGLALYNNDWPLGIAISHNAINDNRVGNIDQWARGLGMRYEQHKDFLCFSALNEGDTVGTKFGNGYDDLPLFSNAHVDPGADYTTPQDNLLALGAALDPILYSTARNAMHKFVDDRGQPASINPSVLVVASNLEYAAAQVTQNVEVAGKVERDMNPYAGNTSVVVAPGAYLDDDTWYVLDNTMPQRPVILQVRQEPQLQVVDDFMGAVPTRFFLWHARYVVGYGNWRWILKGN